MYLGQKHLIECHCILPQYKDKVPLIYHKFPVYSKIDKAGKIVPKYVNCNNCSQTHLVNEICHSEILLRNEDSVAVLTIEDVKVSLPMHISMILDDNECDITTYEQVSDIIENKDFPSEVIINRAIVDEEHHVKILIMNAINSIKIENDVIRTLIKNER